MTVPLIVGYAGSTGSGRWCRKRKTAAYLHRCKFLLRNKHWNYNFFYNLLLNTSGRPLHCEDYDCTTYHDDDKSAVKYRAKGWSAAYCTSEQIQCILQHEQTSPSCPTMAQGENVRTEWGADWPMQQPLSATLYHAALHSIHIYFKSSPLKESSHFWASALAISSVLHALPGPYWIAKFCPTPVYSSITELKRNQSTFNPS